MLDIYIKNNNNFSFILRGFVYKNLMLQAQFHSDSDFNTVDKLFFGKFFVKMIHMILNTAEF